jgi:peptide/nickel transport system substrate-binding protein
MATNGGGLFPIDYMTFYKSTDPAKDIAQKSNNWSGLNLNRWINDEYNALWEQVRTELDPEKQAEMFIAAIVDGAIAKLKGLNRSPWSDETYNVADWYFEE